MFVAAKFFGVILFVLPLLAIVGGIWVLFKLMKLRAEQKKREAFNPRVVATYKSVPQGVRVAKRKTKPMTETEENSRSSEFLDEPIPMNRDGLLVDSATGIAL